MRTLLSAIHYLCWWRRQSKSVARVFRDTAKQCERLARAMARPERCPDCRSVLWTVQGQTWCPTCDDWRNAGDYRKPEREAREARDD